MPLRLRRSLLLSLIVLSIFAAFAPILNLALVHDDGYNIPIIATQTATSVFGFADYGHRDYRPVIAALWLLTRDWFGVFTPAVLHWWSLAAHTLTTALTMALALRLSSRQPLSRATFAAVAGLFMGTFPFSHQAVHWAGAIGHPLMAMFGLGAVHCALTPGRRALIAGQLCILAACLSHEQGFVFGAIAPLMLAGMRFVQRRSLTRRDVFTGAAFAAVGAAYALIYTQIAATVWVSTQQRDMFRSTGIADFAHSLAFNMQAFVAGAVALLRYRILDLFDAAQVTPVLFALFAACVAPALLLLRRFGALRLGIVAIAYWFVALAPSAIFLNHGYIEGAVRIAYPTATGIALFWAAVVAALFVRVRAPLPRLAMLAAPAAFVLWSAGYLTDRLLDMAAFSRGMRTIAAHVARSPAEARVLLINFPAASAPKAPGPAFLRGNEGVMFHTDFNGSPMILVNALTSTPRAAEHVVHNSGAHQGTRFEYFPAGAVVDDGALRPKLLASNLIFRWEFDHGGPNAHLLAEIEPATNATPTTAQLTLDPAHIDVHEARLSRSADGLELDITWQVRSTPTEPVGVFVHIYDAQGQKIGQADADLIAGYLPLDQLPAGLRLREHRRIALDAGAQPATIHIGAYRRSDGQRFHAARPDGAPLDGDEIVAAVQP